MDIQMLNLRWCTQKKQLVFQPPQLGHPIAREIPGPRPAEEYIPESFNMFGATRAKFYPKGLRAKARVF